MQQANFDVNDKSSWYFGAISRQEATEILQNEEKGVFLVRDSSSLKGFVLSVNEGTRVSQYIINTVLIDGLERFQMGDQVFVDLQEILTFYNKHYLDSANLIRPAKKHFEQVIAKFDFEGNDLEDLPFKRGEILQVISKDEQQWWTAKNSLGKLGQIPVPYVEKLTDNRCNERIALIRSSEPVQNMSPTPDLSVEKFKTRSLNHGNSNNHSLPKPDLNRQLPAFARVKQARVPNAYDKTALKLEVNDIIKVLKTNINGQWEGELHGRKGYFPFTHVEFLDD